MDTCPPGKICLNQQLFIVMTLCFAVFITWILLQNNEKWMSSMPQLPTILKKKDDIKDMDNYYYLDNKIDNLYNDKNKSINYTNQEKPNHFSSSSIPNQNIEYNNISPQSITPPLRPIPQYQHSVNSINIPSRGYQPQYQQVGIIHNKNKKNGNIILPLFGKALYPGSSKWQYYASSDGFNTIKLDIKFRKKMGMSEYGCDEISDGDIVGVPAYRQPFIANIYHLDKPTYIPYVN
jgi:hypothetical protein